MDHFETMLRDIGKKQMTTTSQFVILRRIVTMLRLATFYTLLLLPTDSSSSQFHLDFSHEPSRSRSFFNRVLPLIVTFVQYPQGSRRGACSVCVTCVCVRTMIFIEFLPRDYDPAFIYIIMIVCWPFEAPGKDLLAYGVPAFLCVPSDEQYYITIIQTDNFGSSISSSCVLEQARSFVQRCKECEESGKQNSAASLRHRFPLPVFSDGLVPTSGCS